MNNPLLNFSGLPRFNEIKVEHITPAIEYLLAEQRAKQAELIADDRPPTWENFIQPLDDAGEQLWRTWSQIEHLNAVVNSPELREALHANLPKITEYRTEFAHNLALYAKYKTLADSPSFAQLSKTQRKIIQDALRDFRLGGAELPDADKARLKAVQEELALACTEFADHVLDSTNAYGLLIEQESELAGIPEDVLATAREEARNSSGWKLTLHAPCYYPVMQYAERRTLRETLYRAFFTRASEFGEAKWDNTELIQRILRLRTSLARLLSYPSYAHLSLVCKMAQTPQEVLEFLRDFAARAKPFAERDLAELSAFAAEELGITKLEAWDIPYASEKLRQKKYAFSEQEVKKYFPEPRVLAGLFNVAETLYGIRIHAAQAETWHPEVRFFEISDRNGNNIGRFYVDLYARPNKRGGAWMDEAINRRLISDKVQTPVAYLNCNFSRPVGGKPALFTHDEVITLFHEFGHGLHQLLSEVDYLGASSISSVEWDAVELPSQFMENFCWEWDVLKHMTAHVDSGASLSRDLFDKMVAAKNFQIGMITLRQIEFSLFDFHLHYDHDAHGAATPLQLLDQLRREVAVTFPPEYQRFPHSFTHVFSGAYAAGYYSYKWAEVLSADAFSVFEERGVLSVEAGQQFRSEILAKGGSRPALESFIAFRGRPPKIDALLKQQGMIESSSSTVSTAFA